MTSQQRGVSGRGGVALAVQQAGQSLHAAGQLSVEAAPLTGLNLAAAGAGRVAQEVQQAEIPTGDPAVPVTVLWVPGSGHCHSPVGTGSGQVTVTVLWVLGSGHCHSPVGIRVRSLSQSCGFRGQVRSLPCGYRGQVRFPSGLWVPGSGQVTALWIPGPGQIRSLSQSCGCQRSGHCRSPVSNRG